MQIYINTFGTYLHVKDALFELRVPGDGGPSKHHFAAKRVSAIILTVAGALSTDAIRLALQHNVDIIFAERNGMPLGRIWHSKLGSTTRIRKKQLEASLNAIGLDWTLRWLSEKLQRQADFLKDLKKHRPAHHASLEERIGQIGHLQESIQVLRQDADSVSAVADTLRGLEGTAGRLYFGTLNTLLPAKARFNGRSFRPAQDAFNAFLNYGYGILYARVEKALMLAGLDPYVGFMHRDDYNQKSMVYDFIEPYRIYADRVVFRLFSGKKVKQDHLQELANGISLAKPGKELLIDRFNRFFEEDKIRYRNRNQSRANALQQDAHYFANQLIGKDKINVEEFAI